MLHTFQTHGSRSRILLPRIASHLLSDKPKTPVIRAKCNDLSSSSSSLSFGKNLTPLLFPFPPLIVPDSNVDNADLFSRIFASHWTLFVKE